MLNVKVVADYLSKPESDVIQESLRALLLREVSAIEAELARFRQLYSVFDVVELRQKIMSGAVVAHPAWEDLLEWENGLDAIADLKDLLQQGQ
jgi:hypothetical protein